MKTREQLEQHVYELPCANCKTLVRMKPHSWLKHHKGRKLPFCTINGCRKYKKFLSAQEILEVENEYYESNHQ